MSVASRTLVFTHSLRKAGMVVAAPAVALALLAGPSGGLARAQSQCYSGDNSCTNSSNAIQCFNSATGSSCTNYDNRGIIASTITCNFDVEGDSICIVDSPDGPSFLSVCVDGACSSPNGTPAELIKPSVEEASWQVPSISWQLCNVPGGRAVWQKSQTITGRPLDC